MAYKIKTYTSELSSSTALGVHFHYSNHRYLGGEGALEPTEEERQRRILESDGGKCFHFVRYASFDLISMRNTLDGDQSAYLSAGSFKKSPSEAAHMSHRNGSLLHPISGR